MNFFKKISPAILIGLFATVIFTIVIHTVPLLGFKKIDLSREIANRLFGEVKNLYLIGHSIHYFTGISLTILYQLFGRNWVAAKINQSELKSGLGYGTTWSIIAYFISLVFLVLIGRHNLVLSTGVITLLFAHLLYGLIIGLFLEYEK